MSQIILETANGSVTLGAQDGSGNTNVTIPRGALLTSDNLTGSFVKQVKHVRLDTEWTTSATGWQTPLSLNFDAPVGVGNTIIIMASGVVVAGDAADNWGAGINLFIDDTNLTGPQGTGNGLYAGAVDNNSDGGWGDSFGMTAIGIAASTNPTVAIKARRDANGSTWNWIGLGYTSTTYGKAATNLVAFEIGV